MPFDLNTLLAIIAIVIMLCTAFYFLRGSSGVDYSVNGRSKSPRGGKIRGADFNGGGASGRWQSGSRDFLEKFDGDAVIAAIRAAAETTTGEIRVTITKKNLAKDAINTEALRHFHALGMHKAQQRNGVLIFIAPNTQEFAITADEGIQSKSGAAPWRRATTQMREAFAKGEYTEGVTAALTTIATALASEFPQSGG